MKTANQSENVSNGLIAAWYVAGVLFLGCPLSSKAIESVGPSADAVKEAAPAATFSSGLADIVKMVDAKVDPEVIKTYIKSAPTAYNPSATEIIALKDHGVGPEVLTAMLQRGAELRAQAMRPSPTVPNSAGPQAIPGAANPYAPVYDYGAQPVYQTFTD
ncbi:MAG: hypothetical protein NT154_33780, partial [Verrucomicrobia bacterium]|nr:hypothetical protein [Verrucomicrobiota bacterium]